MNRRLNWILLGGLLLGALFVGSRSDSEPTTVRSRVERIGAEVKCPTCEGLAVSESNAPSSEAMKDVIREQVEEGRSDAEIRSYLVSRYGKDILLRPPASGIGALVWVLPVAALVVAGFALVLTFRRWNASSTPPAPLSDEDRARVAQALQD